MSTPLPPPDHRVKVTHLVFGLLFLGIVGVWALVTGDLVPVDRLTYLGPGVLIAAGVLGLVASLASTRRRTSSQQHPYDDTATEEIR